MTEIKNGRAAFGSLINIIRTGDMIMKEQFIKWISVLALISFAAAVFIIADGHFLPGIVLIGAGSSLSSIAAIYKKKNDAAGKEQKTN